jgi:type II secretory ATPase GspE/PulE/Tfp pilus assembly ATPase PilB-like protein
MQNTMKLGELLITLGLVTSEQLDVALEIQQYRQLPLGQILVEQGFVTKDGLLDAIDSLGEVGTTVQSIAESSGALAEGGEFDLSPMLSGLVSAALTQLAKSHRTDDPLDEGAITEEDTRPVTGLVTQVLESSVRRRASDIHIEPRANDVLIRHRIDGKLMVAHRIPKALQAALVARIKIMANLDIVEYRIPQDGRLSVTVDAFPVDLRVSVLPTYHGQRVVLRVLDKRSTHHSLTELGFSDSNLGLLLGMLDKPHGMILVTGPTGSGKTTTLYAALNQIKQTTINILTCEDPVEYDIEGIGQSHVNEKVGLTFAAQLRAILRQDPDVILVGEIRDAETAQTAVRAALTGHLVLSTLHCNDAASAIPRLLDMGIEPFLLSSVLLGVMAQRLVRVLCPSCKTEYAPDSEERLILQRTFGDAPMKLWRRAGCPDCSGLGFHGRTGIHEILPVGPAVQRAIATGQSLDRIREEGAADGFRPMALDAWKRILAGQTDLEEAATHVLFESAPQSPVVRIDRAVDKPMVRAA